MRKIFDAVLATAGFLTVIPVGRNPAVFQRAAMAPAFPVAGAIIGAALLLAYKLIDPFLTPLITACLLIGLSVFLTGGFHLDGLADTVDGLASSYDKQKVLDVMSESTIGAFGVIAICLALILKVAILAAILENVSTIIPALLSAFVLSRWALVLVLFISKNAKDNSLTSSFFNKTGTGSFLIATFVAAAILFPVLKPAILVFVFLISVFVTVLMAKYFEYRISGNTGDTFGAICEANEVAVLFVLLFSQFFIQ